MINFLDLIKIKLQTKKMSRLESFSGEVIFEFPKKYRVRNEEETLQVFDLKDMHFLMNFSIYNTKTYWEDDFEKDFQDIKNENPNAEIQSTGKYDCICSASRTEKGNEIYYAWEIGYKTKRILATLIIFDLFDREEIDKRIFLAGDILAGITIFPLE